VLRSFFLKWFQENGRDFPWRESDTTPFQILVTEMLLRQTRAENVNQIWIKFKTNYPDARKLYAAKISELKKIIKPLGFVNQRSEALKHASKHLIENYNGEVPKDIKLLLAVPHVGLYSSSAVLCFAFNKKIEIVDTNVLRLFSRLYGLNLKPDIRREPLAWEIARELLPREAKKAKFHNYGMLDFTAQICKSIRPKCEVCPLNKICVWGRQQLLAKQ